MGKEIINLGREVDLSPLSPWIALFFKRINMANYVGALDVSLS
jgi:uncharacterized membrane protein